MCGDDGVLVEIERERLPLYSGLQFQLWHGYQKVFVRWCGVNVQLVNVLGRKVEKRVMNGSVEGRKTNIRNSLIQPREVMTRRTKDGSGISS